MTLNHILLEKNQQVPLNHDDIIELGAGAKFVYVYQLQGTSKKKKRLPISGRNYGSIRDSPSAFNSWVKSRKSLERTLAEEDELLDQKLEEQKTLTDQLLREEQNLVEECERVKKDAEESLARERGRLEEKLPRCELELKNELHLEKETRAACVGQSAPIASRFRSQNRGTGGQRGAGQRRE